MLEKKSVIAILSGNEWNDAGIVRLVTNKAFNIKDLYKIYTQLTLEPFLTFSEWLIDEGYVKEAEDTDIVVFDDIDLSKE